MPKYVNYEISFAPALLDPLGVSVKWKEQIWCLNMKSIHNELRMHGSMHILWYLGHC